MAETTVAPAQRRERLVGFDLIRLISFWIIACYHFVYAVWHDRLADYNATMSTNFVYWRFVYPTLRSLSFSGHSVLFLTAMLLAMTRKSFRAQARFWCFLFIAWMTFVWAEGDFSRFLPYWDIHLLILTGLIIMMLAEHRPGWVTGLGLIGFVSTFFSFWTYSIFAALPLALRHPLVGDCEFEVSSWPILPWLGFFFFGYAVGFILRASKWRQKFSTISKQELGAWIGVLMIASFNLGGFYKLQALEDWECHAFRLPPLEFWAHFIFVMFCIRISLVTSVNRWLSTALPFLSKLNVSKNFFLAYALQYIFAFILAVKFGGILRANPTLFMVTSVMMLPMAEALAWTTAKLGARRLIKGPD